MFSHDHYVPVVFTKQGERTGVAALAGVMKDRITPLFVVPNVDWDFENSRPKKSVADHIAKLPSQLNACWGDRRAFIDLTALSDDDLPDGQHPVEWLTEQTRQLGMNLVPVTSARFSPAYQLAVGRVVARDGRGACFRLGVVEWPYTSGVTTIDSLLHALSISITDVDLVLDLGTDVTTPAEILLRNELANLPAASDWRSLSVAGTAMPQTMPSGRGLHPIARSEWGIYERLALAGGSLRMPAFADYCIQNPQLTNDVDPRYMSISGTIRYTANSEWLIAKGGLFKGAGDTSEGGAALIPAAQLLIADPRIMDTSHCATEKWISDVATGLTGGSSPQTWRKFATTHHLKVVTEQVASLFGP